MVLSGVCPRVVVRAAGLPAVETMTADNTKVYVSQRPDKKDRLFESKAVEKKI